MSIPLRCGAVEPVHSNFRLPFHAIAFEEQNTTSELCVHMSFFGGLQIPCRRIGSRILGYNEPTANQLAHQEHRLHMTSISAPLQKCSRLCVIATHTTP